jgi:hypothetical protein
MRPRSPLLILARLVCRALTVQPIDYEQLCAYLEQQAEKEAQASPASFAG